MPPANIGDSSAIPLRLMAGRQHLDLILPIQIPLAAILPGLTKQLGILTPETASQGFVLTNELGAELDQQKTLADAQVTPGALLNVTVHEPEKHEQQYDDLIEAVALASEESQSPWLVKDSAVMSLIASISLFLTGSILLTIMGPAGPITPIIVGTGALILLCVSAVCARSKIEVRPSVFALTACALTAMSAWAALPQSTLGLRLLTIGGALLFSAALGCIALTTQLEDMAIAVVVGAVLFIVGAVINTLGYSLTHTLSIATASCGLLLAGAHWVALARTPLRVYIPRSTQELNNDQQVLDFNKIVAQTREGQNLARALRIGSAIVIVGATPILAANSPLGAALVSVIAVAALLGARDFYSRANVLIGTSTGIASLMLAGIFVAIFQPQLLSFVSLGAVLCGALILTTNVFYKSYRPALSRLADTVNVMCLVAIPLLTVLVCKVI